jgi:hypothetical protein
MGRDKLNALNAFFHHTVDGILTGTTYANNFNSGEGFGLQISFVRVHVFLLARNMPYLKREC